MVTALVLIILAPANLALSRADYGRFLDAASSQRVPENEQAMILGVQEFVRIRKRFPRGLD